MAGVNPRLSVMRELQQLVDTAEPGIALVREWIKAGSNPVDVLSVERAAGETALLALQVTSRSPMGAIALETGGLLIDHGWIRVLGGGHARLPRTIHEWNGIAPGEPSQRLPGAVVVADDAIGGFFALNGVGLPGPAGHVFYLSPSTVRWTDIASSYSEWLTGLFGGNLTKFYEGERWAGWEKDAAALAGDQGFSISPFLFAAGPEIGRRSRRAVPIEELWELHARALPEELGP